MAGLYIHIPFCESRCIYCGFYSTTNKEKYQDKYIGALIKEFKLRSDYLFHENIDTIYIGGGTPSTLSSVNLKRIASIVNHSVSEFTVECNPDDMTEELAHTLCNIGVNRVSLGVQTFSDKRLRFLNRRHSSLQIQPAINLLRKAGIKNISIDLMFGFPQQTLQEWQHDLLMALTLDVEHISAYSLMYEEGTPLYKMLKEKKIMENEEATTLQMYDLLIDTLINNGYEHYEISNFSKPGHHSIHNSNYWNGTKYIGLGASAHSYDGNSRQWNISNIETYISSIDNGCVPMNKELLDDVTRYNDMITTALRTSDGIILNNLTDNFRNYLISNAQKHISENNLRIDGDRLHLTRKGLYICDSVMTDLIWA